MLFGDRMIDATNPALYKRPEPFDGLGMHVPAHIDTLCVTDAVMLVSRLLERVINRVFVRVDGGLRQHIFFDVRHDSSALNVRHGHGHNVTLALYHPKHGRFVRSIDARTPLAPVAPRPANISFVYLDRIPASERAIVLQHQLVANQICHAPRRFIGDAKFALQLLRGNSATSARHQVHRIEPQMQRRGGLVEDRPRCRMYVMTARLTRPRLALLRRFVAGKFRSAAAPMAHRMDSIFRVTIAPQPLKAGRIIGEIRHELHQRKLGIRRLCAYRFISIYWRHVIIRAQSAYTVKGYLPMELIGTTAVDRSIISGRHPDLHHGLLG